MFTACWPCSEGVHCLRRSVTGGPGGDCSGAVDFDFCFSHAARGLSPPTLWRPDVSSARGRVCRRSVGPGPCGLPFAGLAAGFLLTPPLVEGGSPSFFVFVLFSCFSCSGRLLAPRRPGSLGSVLFPPLVGFVNFWLPFILNLGEVFTVPYFDSKAP